MNGEGSESEASELPAVRTFKICKGSVKNFRIDLQQ